MTDREAFAAELAATLETERLRRFTEACEAERLARSTVAFTRAEHTKAVRELEAAWKARERAALAFEGRSR